MPPLSSRLNLKNLENSDQSVGPAAGGTKSTSTGSSDTEMKNSSIPIQRNENNSDDKESSNDASNETSDSDKSLVSHKRNLGKSKIPSRKEEEDNEADDERPAELVEEASPADEIAATDGAAPLTKRFFCSTCNQGFTRKHNMVSHELIHLSSKPHVCTLCSILFRRIHDLKRHEKLHTGEKPFHCEKCNRRFARTDALTRHLNSPNACSGKVKEETSLASASGKLEEADPLASKPLHSASGSSSNSVVLTDMSAKTTSATETSIEGRLGSDVSLKKVSDKPRSIIAAAGSLSSDSLAGGISDTINKANYDVHRWRAFQHQQQNSQKHGLNYPYNTTITTTTTTVTTENEHIDESERRRRSSHNEIGNEQQGNTSRSFQENQGQHYHHHYHHHHHHSENRSNNKNVPGGLASWSIPSDREVHHDGQFRKHDEFYPRDIRASRKEPDGGNSSREFKSTFGNMSHGEFSPRHSFDLGFASQEQIQGGPRFSSFSDGSRNQGPLQRESFNRAPLAKWPSQPENKFPYSVESSRPPIARFVSMEKYADLLNYTNDLQASLSMMDGRIKILEHAEHQREEDEQASPKRRKSSHDE